MKQYLAYKKQVSKILLLTLLVIVAIFPAAFPPLRRIAGEAISYAQTATDLQNKIDQKSNDIEKLEQEIKQYQAELNNLGQQKNSLSVSLKELDLNRKKLVADISVTQKKIDKTNLKIEGLSSDIVDKEDTIANNVDAIALGIRQTDEFEQNNILGIILSQNNFSTIWNDIDAIATVSEQVRGNIVNLKKVKVQLESTKKSTIDAKNELTALRSELADQKKIVEQNTRDKNKLLAQTKNNETGYQKLLKDRLAKKDAFEKELSDYESQLKYILDPSKLPGAGVLAWPLDNIYITNPFGKTASRVYASGWHNGTDFRASVGTPVRAMAAGVVAGTGDTDVQCSGVSFGRFILIKYDDGLASTYGHMSLIKASTGQRVERGEIVGYSGNTGYSTGPHLHVSVYARDAVDVKTLPSKSCPGRILTQPISPTNAYLDPMFYLPPYKK